jgi:hypothetical protein
MTMTGNEAPCRAVTADRRADRTDKPAERVDRIEPSGS